MRYKITGTSPLIVDGKQHQPGDIFIADLPPEQEKVWLRGRHITRLAMPPVVPQKPKSKKPTLEEQ